MHNQTAHGFRPTVRHARPNLARQVSGQGCCGTRVAKDRELTLQQLVMRRQQSEIVEMMTFLAHGRVVSTFQNDIGFYRPPFFPRDGRSTGRTQFSDRGQGFPTRKRRIGDRRFFRVRSYGDGIPRLCWIFDGRERVKCQIAGD
jgi:hypothetical protein